MAGDLNRRPSFPFSAPLQWLPPLAPEAFSPPAPVPQLQPAELAFPRDSFLELPSNQSPEPCGAGPLRSLPGLSIPLCLLERIPPRESHSNRTWCAASSPCCPAEG